MSRLFGRDTIYVALWVVPLIAAAAVTPVITRFMPPAEFGTVASAIAIMQVLFVVAGFGLDIGIQRHYTADGGAVDARRLLGLSILVASAATAVAFLTGPVWCAWLGLASFDAPVRLAVLWAGTSAVTACALALLRSQDRLGPFAAVSLLQSLVAALASMTLVIAVSPTATMFMLGQLLTQCVAVTVALVTTPPLLISRAHGPLVRSALLYSVPLVPSELSTFALGSSNRLVILAQLGAVPLAGFQIAYNVGSMPILALTALNYAWLPRFFAIGDADARADIAATSRDALLHLLSPVLLGFAFGTPIILRLWAPPSYHTTDLVLVTSVIIVAALPNSLGLAATRRLLTTDRTVAISVITIAAGALNIGLNIVLVARLELVGAALATVISYSVWAALLSAVAHRVHAVRRPRWTVIVGVAVTVVGVLLLARMPDSGAYLAVRLVGGAVTVAWFAVLLRRLGRGAAPTAA
jgi:O-antigen/teichoic acid export membrane protein